MWNQPSVNASAVSSVEAEVAAHDRRALQPDLADLAAPARRRRRRRRSQLDDRRDRLADALGIGDVRGAEVGDRRARCLGEAVAVARARRATRTVRRCGARVRAARAWRPTRCRSSDSSVAALRLGRLEQLEHRRRHAGDRGDLLRARRARPPRSASHLYMRTIFPPAAVYGSRNDCSPPTWNSGNVSSVASGGRCRGGRRAGRLRGASAS